MAARQSMPQAYKRLAASAVVLMLAAWQAGPANAASNSHILSEEVADATLHIPNSKLTTEIADREATENDDAPTRLLAPRAEAAIREAFKAVATTPMAEAKSSPEATEVDDVPAETPRGMNTRLPGVSEKDLSLFRKQMYRKDI